MGYVERDAFAAAVLLARMEDATLAPAPIWLGDLAEFDATPLADLVDVVCAGFPYQPFSLAGIGRGLEDERWIFPDIAGIVRDVGPRLVFLENVAAIVDRGMAEVLGTLADLGYDATWDLFRASDVEAPHRRERWFCLGSRGVPDAFRDALRILPERGRGAARSADAGHAEPRELGGDLAERASGGLGELRPASRRSRQSLGGDSGMGDAHGARRKNRARRTHAHEGRSEPSGGRGSVDDADALGCGGGDGRDAQERRGSISPRRHVRLADAQRDGCEDERVAEHAVEPGASGTEPHGCRVDWSFPWPPGPRDLERWALIDGEAQPVLRGMASRLSSRVDRLRCLGNAVVPAQAGLAFRVLLERLLR